MRTGNFADPLQFSCKFAVPENANLAIHRVHNRGGAAVLRITRVQVLAVEAVLLVACDKGARPVRHELIAEELALPRRYLEAVMQRLVRGGILKGVRGPLGGYRLARPAEDLTVGDVVRCLLVADPDTEDALDGASQLGQRLLSPFWRSLQGVVLARMNETSIADLMAGGLARPADAISERPVAEGKIGDAREHHEGPVRASA